MVVFFLAWQTKVTFNKHNVPSASRQKMIPTSSECPRSRKFCQRDFLDDFPQDSSTSQVGLSIRYVCSVSPGDSLPRTSFSSNYSLSAHAGSTFTDYEAVGELLSVFFGLFLFYSCSCAVNDQQLASISLLCGCATIWMGARGMRCQTTRFPPSSPAAVLNGPSRDLGICGSSLVLIIPTGLLPVGWVRGGGLRPCDAMYSPSHFPSHSSCCILHPSAIAVSHSLYRVAVSLSVAKVCPALKLVPRVSNVLIFATRQLLITPPSIPLNTPFLLWRICSYW